MLKTCLRIVNKEYKIRQYLRQNQNRVFFRRGVVYCALTFSSCRSCLRGENCFKIYFLGKSFRIQRKIPISQSRCGQWAIAVYNVGIIITKQREKN